MANDRIRFLMRVDELKKNSPISLSSMPIHELTTERILEAVENVLQSNDLLELNNSFKIYIIWADSLSLRGSGRHVPGRKFDVGKFIESKRSII